MSNPVSQADVEDVLASIRRLVSDHKRPVQNGEGDEEPKTVDAVSSEIPQPDTAGGKLVLTPALRVPDANAGASDSADNKAEEGAGPVWLAPEMLETSAPLHEFAEAQQPYILREVAEAEQPDEDDQTNAEVVDTALESSSGLDEWVQQEGFAEPAFDAPLILKSSVLGEPEQDQVFAETVAAPAAEPDQAEDTPLPSIRAMQSATDPEPMDEPDNLSDTTSSDPNIVQASSGTSRTLSATDYDPQLELGAKIAALEEVIARRKDQWEPDGVGTDPYSGTAAPKVDWMPEDVSDLPHFASTRNAPERVDSGFDGEETNASAIAEQAVSEAAVSEIMATETDPIDEDALQQIVGRIVREELQGPLGERITRNVRMLVRREIHRALASRDFD